MGLEPTQTAFLQALNIATRINKGQIMILNDVKLLTEGEKVGASQATLLQKLKIRPFHYGLQVLSIFDDGSVYGPKVLDFNFDTLSTKIASVALQIGYPCLPSVPHSLVRGFKNLALAVATDIEFKQAEEIKNLLNMSPEALAAMVASQQPDAPAGGSAPAPVEEEEEEEDEDMGFGLFD